MTGDGRRVETLAKIIHDSDPSIYNISLPGVEIEKPATLVLRNVDLRYNGTYIFTLATASLHLTSEVTLFVPGKLISFFVSLVFINAHLQVFLLRKVYLRSS